MSGSCRHGLPPARAPVPSIIRLLRRFFARSSFYRGARIYIAWGNGGIVSASLRLKNILPVQKNLHPTYCFLTASDLAGYLGPFQPIENFAENRTWGEAE